MPQENSAILKINEQQADYARKISASMSKPIYRKKGLVDILGIACAISYFSELGFKVNVSRSLHKIPEIFEEFKITDFYINNYRIDVITLFRDSLIRVPKAHADYDCAPDYYLVVQMGPRIKEAKIMGYFRPVNVPNTKVEGDYVVVDDKCLRSVDDLYKILKTPGYPKQIQGKHLDCMALFLRFIDKELASTYKKLLIQHLITCPACVRKFADVLEFNKTVNNMPELADFMQKNSSRAKSYEDETFNFIDKKAYKEDIEVPFDTKRAKKTKFEELEDDDFIPASQKGFKNVIDTIFSNVANFDPAKMGTIVGGNRRKIIISAICICLFLFMSGVIALKNSTSKISSISDVDNYSQEGEYSSQAQDEFTQSHSLPQDMYTSQSGGVDYSLASEATGEPVVATINKISWEVPENLANKANYKRFLQLVGKNIKLNLQNDLLLSNDFAKNNVIKLNIRIASNGDIIGMKITQSSGSHAIDEIIKKSVGETLTYMKPPSHGLIARPVDVTLIISL